MDKSNATISITTGTVIKTLLLLVLLWLVYLLLDLVLVVLTAVVIASAIEPATKWFMKKKVPRTLAVLVVYLIVLGLFFGFMYFFVPPVLADTAGFMSSLPQYLETLNPTWAFNYAPILGAAGADASFSIAQMVAQLQTALSQISTNTLSAASLVFGGVLSFVLIIVFSFYFAVQETGILDFLRVITPKKHQPYVIDLWRRAQHKIGLWMQGQLLLALIVGVLVYLGLTVLGVKYALVLAVLAAMFELIPVFGPILSSVPAIVIGFVDGGAGLGLLVIALYIIIQQFENHLIYPLVVTKVVGVPPLLVILALIVGWKLVGFLGIILSIPIAAAIQEVASDLEKRRDFVLGEE
jgi:predicted PurR-regulated permease PerM